MSVLPDPPRPGEIWRLGRDPSHVALVLECGDGRVSYLWLEGSSPGGGSVAVGQWMSAFEVVLEKQDHADATPVRRRLLIDDFRDRLRGRSVLELGAHVGGLTESIVRHARATTLLENNSRCIPVLVERFGRVAEILPGDAHHALWRLPRGRFDVIVCAGLIYHSAHPLWLLEGMANLAPRAVLLDTIDQGVEDARTVPAPMTNSLNYRYNRHPDCGLSLILADDVIVQVMARLGYGRATRIRKDDAALPAGADSAYFQAWRRGLAAWFEREGDA